MDSPPPKGRAGSFVLMTHNNRVDLADLLALAGADSSRIIRHAVFVAMDGGSDQLDEHTLLMSGHFDQARIYKSVVEGGDVVTHYRGIPILEIQPLARERGEFNEVRWLAVLDSDVLLFGSIASVHEELDRYLAGSAPDPSLMHKLSHLRHDDETWCVLTATGRNLEVQTALASLDPKLANLAGDADAFQFGIRYRKQVEFEYEVATASATATRSISESLKQTLAGPGKASSLLSSPVTTGDDNTVRGVIKIPVEKFSTWLEDANTHRRGEIAASH
jgi:hypothetical protein